MTSDASSPEPAQRRKLGMLVLSLGVILFAIIVLFTLITRQWWMLGFLLLIIPNVVIGVRELRASRQP